MALNFTTLTKPVSQQVVDPNTGVMREEWVLYFQRVTDRLNGAVDELSGGGGGGLTAVVDDTSPQLGGDLDLNSQDITGTGNIDIDGYGGFKGGAMPITFPDAGVYVGIETNGNANMSIVSAGTYGYFDIGGVDPNDYQCRFLVEIATGDTELTTVGDFTINGLTPLYTGAIGSTVQAWDAQLDEWATVDPSTNGKSLVAAADYAAMRGLLDLEAGTDFYSISAADAAFLSPAEGNAAYQPLDSDLTAIAALTTATFGRALLTQADAAATLATIAALGQGKHTIWIPATAMISRTTNGAAAGTVETTTNKNMFKTLDFDTTTQEFAQFEVFFPKSWNLGTVTFQPVLSHASGSGNAVFGLAGVARSSGDAGDVAFGTAQTSDTTVGTANAIYIGPESSAITIAGTPAAGDTVQFQVNRTVASDNLGVDARLHGIRLFFTINAVTDA